ncbi:cytidyltransferase domain protein [Oesophagostomum dentatum]|uniref:ethanolamine-phosphate cytidylyltransferase n=1 Tax=Oesophagostomum dentatum TaxID=61180 RepID=A0A0B1SZJ6_OESDE|nr:cytidyltransferase domain protein [Oesophagostomum dentatum]
MHSHFFQILRNTGQYPIFSEDERYRLVSSLKFVDRVVEDAPYHIKAEILKDQNCGLCFSQGSNNRNDYPEESSQDLRCTLAKQAFEVSCQDIIGRVIRMRTALHDGGWLYSPWHDTPFLATSETFKLFSDGSKPKPGDKIVYTCGAFDFFNVGHLAFLEKAKSFGDYLIVGIYSDEIRDLIQAEGCHPVMSLYERALCAFAYKPVDEILLGAPRFIANDMLDRFKIDVVVRGSVTPESDQERFAVAKKRGILRCWRLSVWLFLRERS